ncbi:hypothetical protein [Actinophytocola sp.]|uniref:hypothetical protein n=1 Tax=Actinophytocola sp. TaxID=1872138 RepID=UPI003D6B626E
MVLRFRGRRGVVGRFCRGLVLLPATVTVSVAGCWWIGRTVRPECDGVLAGREPIVKASRSLVCGRDLRFDAPDADRGGARRRAGRRRAGLGVGGWLAAVRAAYLWGLVLEAFGLRLLVFVALPTLRRSVRAAVCVVLTAGRPPR